MGGHKHSVQVATALYLLQTKEFHHEHHQMKTVIETFWEHIQSDLYNLIIKRTSHESSYTHRNRRLIVTNYRLQETYVSM